MRSGIYYINFMKCNRMHNLFSLLYLSLWTIYESSLWTHSIILWSSSKTSTGFWYFTRSFIDCDDITCDNFLFLDCLYHFLTQIIDCLHLSCFKCYFTCFRSRCWWFLDLDLYDLSFNYFALLFNSNTNWSSKCLCKSLCFAHL